MKHYKNEWQSHDDDDTRKSVATQMASTTKNWVSMPESTSEKEEEKSIDKPDENKKKDDN